MKAQISSRALLDNATQPKLIGRPKHPPQIENEVLLHLRCAILLASASSEDILGILLIIFIVEVMMARRR